ncbi:MAG: hypothetical protein VW239_10920, partial [Candidatus Nanopelagicales bacterium]
ELEAAAADSTRDTHRIVSGLQEKPDGRADNQYVWDLWRYKNPDGGGVPKEGVDYALYGIVQNDSTRRVVRWNDAGTPVVTFTDPNPLGAVCFWQVRVLSVTVDDVQIAADGSTTCSTATTFTLDGDVDWSKVTSVDIRGTAIPQVTALDSWGLAGVESVPYEPRLTPAGGAAPSVQLQVDQFGYPEVHVTGSSCRYVAQWRIPGESLWR